MGEKEATVQSYCLRLQVTSYICSVKGKALIIPIPLGTDLCIFQRLLKQLYLFQNNEFSTVYRFTDFTIECLLVNRTLANCLTDIDSVNFVMLLVGYWGN